MKKQNHATEKSPYNRAAAARRCTEARTERRNKALSLFSLVELLMHLGLRHAEGTACPYCNDLDTLALDSEKQAFRCTSCKHKGGRLQLVKQAKSLSDWEAIAFLEELSDSQT